MASLTGTTTISDLDMFATGTIQTNDLGQLNVDSYGRKFRYVKAGASNLVIGNLLQGPARDTQFTSLTVVTGAAGSKTLTLTNGTTTTTQDMFAGGEAVVSVTPGLGQVFKITGNSIATSGATLTVTLEEPIRTALTTSSRVTLHLNDYNGVIATPTTKTGKAVGVAISAIPAGGFGWIQSGGPSAALSDATVAALGEGLSPSTTTAGCTTKAVTLIDMIGAASILQVSGAVQPIFLTID